MTVELSGVSFTYPGTGTGVQGVEFTVGTGELVTVIGASGSGKTTLLKLLAGFLQPAQGRILLDGADVTRLPPRRRELGIVFQSYALFPHMRAWENVAYPLKVRGLSLAERHARAARALDMVGLSGLGERHPPTLSGGQQQRVALARALVFKPKALLLDEPLSALDAALRVAMRDEISRVQRAAGIATLHVTHDQEEALSLGDRVAVVQHGRLVQIDEPRRLYEAPKTRSIAAFVGQANLFDARVSAPGTVETAFGALRCSTAGWRPGDRAVVLIRPERVDIGQAPDGVNAFACRVDRDRFLGSTRRFDALVNGERLLGETTDLGTVDAVSVKPEHIRLLPPDEPAASGRDHQP